ncbi:KAP family P-loop NTPase fold protein [Terasakiella pusilla]|uniref:KAP family P-loop NTPase fold protein n=1 Tax=Terasakiella pusilla TaxID=64973 RepID=UPI003AA8F434
MGLSRKVEENYNDRKPWDGDVLGRKQLAGKLTTLVGGLRSSFVISLEGSYGEGKTFFLRNWQKDLQEQGYITAYFNSWESDHLEDPFLPFMAVLAQAISVGDGNEKTLLDTAKKFSGKLVKYGGPVVAKAVLRRLVGDNGIEELKDIVDSDTEGEFISHFGDAVGTAMSNQLEQQEGLEKFRGSLKEAISELTQDLSEDKRKIIVLVDELDRCKPTYAVKVLERIKHFFEVEGLVFILAMNEEQVANSMRTVYGAGLNAEEYLRRFIHWRFALPKPPAVNYANLLVKNFGLHELPELQKWEERPGPTNQNWHHSNYDRLASNFAITSEALGLTLRQQEQAFTAVNLFIRTRDKGTLPYSQIIGFLAPLWLMKKQKAGTTSRTWEELVEVALKQGERGVVDFGEEALLTNVVNCLHSQNNDLYPVYFKSHVGTFEKISAWFISNTLSKDLDLKRDCRLELNAIYDPDFKIDANTSVAAYIWALLEKNSQLLLNLSDELADFEGNNY